MAQNSSNISHIVQSPGEEWREIKEAFLRTLGEEGYDEEECSEFRENLLCEIVDFDVRSERGVGESGDKWHLWYELIDELKDEVCGRCDVRGETIDELWDFLLGPKAGFAREAHVFFDDAGLYEAFCEKVSEDGSCSFERRGDFLKVSSLCGGRVLKVHLYESDAYFYNF